MSVTDRPAPLPVRVLRGLLRAIPRPLIERLGRNAPVNRAGDRLAPEIALAIAVLNRLPADDVSNRSPERAREQIRVRAQLFADSFPPFAVVEDLEIPSDEGPIPATRYRAAAAPSGAVILYFHGGGWVLGDRISTDSAVRTLAAATGLDVVSVDYRLAPEHPFPAAIDDALTAYDWCVDRCRTWGAAPDRIVVAGDSAGANIAAAISGLLRDTAHPPMLQVLLAPALDLVNQSESYAEFAEGFFLSRKQIDWYKCRYLRSYEQAGDPRVSPLLDPDLAGLPPAYIGVAGFDPLRDEGIAYARRLADAGVPVTLHRAGEMIHPFMNITGFSPAARDAALAAASAITDAVAVRARADLLDDDPV